MKQHAILTILFLQGFFCCLAGNASIAGKWAGSVQLPDSSSYPVMYIFQISGDSLIGSATAEGVPKPIHAGKIKGNDCSFSIQDDDGSLIVHNGTYYSTGDSISLTILYRGSRLHSILKRADNSPERKVGSFSKMRVQGRYIVYLSQNGNESVQINAPVEIADRIVTEVKNGVLVIRNRHDNWSAGAKSWYSGKSWWHTHDKVVVYVSARSLTKISTAGSANVYFNGGLKTDIMKVKVLGSGTVEGQIWATRLKTRLAGSAHIKLSGTVNQLLTNIKGSGNLDAGRLIAVHAGVHILGSGHALINATKTVKASLYGSSALDCYGPAQLSSRKMGSAAINKKNS